MAILTVTFVDPSPALDTKSAEVAYLENTLQELAKEIGRGRGTVTSGTVSGMSSGGVPNTSRASWTYSPVASKP